MSSTQVRVLHRSMALSKCVLGLRFLVSLAYLRMRAFSRVTQPSTWAPQYLPDRPLTAPVHEDASRDPLQNIPHPLVRPP